MYSFGQHIRKPWEPDPYGVDYERLMNPTQNLQGFQFSQDPNSMMAPPMGIGAGGVPEVPNYMSGMSAGGAGPGAPAYGGGNMAGAASMFAAAGKAANMAANESKAAPAQAGRGAGIQETMLNWGFWDALNEMKQNKRRR